MSQGESAYFSEESENIDAKVDRVLNMMKQQRANDITSCTPNCDFEIECGFSAERSFTPAISLHQSSSSDVVLYMFEWLELITILCQTKIIFFTKDDYSFFAVPSRLGNMDTSCISYE